MTRVAWQEFLLPPGNEGEIWELFHENSKLGKYNNALPDEEVRARMQEFHESLPFEGYPVLELPGSLSPFNLSLSDALATRVSVRNFSPRPLTLENLATILYYAYGVRRDDKGTAYLRSLRVVPSGGALYPLEIFFHNAHIEGLKPGLYHYNPIQHHLKLLHEGNHTGKISETIVHPSIVVSASLVLFITAVFERSIFKYKDRGYRFILLEAGHVAQNVNLVATALGLGSINIGGFFDRQVDEFLGLDGLTHSTIYLVAIGGKAEQPQGTDTLA
jgi:SagB-type dehydrogenase family enzyme